MAHESDGYKEILKRAGLKNTRHRNSILEVMEYSDQPVTAEQIYLELKEKNISINLSTVYRVLETLVSRGFVNKSSIIGDNKALYELNRMEHRHHLICVGCKKMFPVDGCPFDEYEKLLQNKTGFDITGHKLEIYGYCKKCRAFTGL